LAGVVDALRRDVTLTVFCRDEGSGLRRVPPSRISDAMFYVPLVRGLRDWHVLITESHFDRHVARRLPHSDVFHGVAGQCAESLAAARSLGSPTLLDALNPHIHHYAEHDRRECRRLGIRASVHPRLEARIEREYAQSDLIRVESEFARATFLERGVPAERVVAIQPPIDALRFRPRPPPEDAFRACFIGLFYPWKGFHYLIEAFNRLNRPGAELLLWGGIGHPTIRRYLERQVAHNPAIRLGAGDLHVTGHDRLFARMSVLVHPSLADGWAYVVSEAMASGVPVIVTAYTGASEVVDDGVNGYVVPPGDSGAIADRLDHLARNRPLLERMGIAARRTAERLTPKRFSERYRALITSTAHGNAEGSSDGPEPRSGKARLRSGP
jgi:glycosyltransferase involved in cell wall biosynthesis